LSNKFDLPLSLSLLSFSEKEEKTFLTTDEQKVYTSNFIYKYLHALAKLASAMGIEL